MWAVQSYEPLGSFSPCTVHPMHFSRCVCVGRGLMNGEGLASKASGKHCCRPEATYRKGICCCDRCRELGSCFWPWSVLWGPRPCGQPVTLQHHTYNGMSATADGELGRPPFDLVGREQTFYDSCHCSWVFSYFPCRLCQASF